MCRFNNCLQLAVHLSIKHNPTASIHSPKEKAQIHQTSSLSENDCGGHELNFLTFQRKKNKSIFTHSATGDQFISKSFRNHH